MFSDSDISEIKSQSIKYIITGVWNTVFGILVYALLIKLLGENHYILLAVVSNIISITNAYICYKLFVFKTKGNILKEYLKCYVVYGLSMLLGLLLLYVLVDIAGLNPVIANVISVLLLTIVSFIGHRYYSFKNKS